jgi:hypothetical protein
VAGVLFRTFENKGSNAKKADKPVSLTPDWGIFSMPKK